MKITRKILAFGLVALLGAATLTGCGGGSDSADETSEIVIAGSTSVQPLSEELAKTYMEANEGVTITVQGGGSGQGAKSIAEGIAQIGALSREVKDEEKDSVGNEYVIALDGVGLIVHKDVKADDLTIEQIRDIYLGEITNWKEVGGDDVEISVVSREEGSGTRGAFVELTGVEEDDEDRTTDNALIQSSTGAVVKTVAETPNSIGYVSLEAIDDTVKTVKVEGVEPSNETVLDGTYKIKRPFIYITPADENPEAVKFIEFVMSDEGKAAIEENGFIPPQD